GAGRAPVPQLADVVPGTQRPPAPHGAVRQERTGVKAALARGNRESAGDPAHPHGSGRARGGPVAKLTLEVPPPALHRTVPQQRTGVTIAAADGDSPADAARAHGRGRARGGAVAEFPLDVLSPALHRAVTTERAGVGNPPADGDGTGEAAPADG